MPVIIRKEEEDMWLNQENNDFDKLYNLLTPYPPDLMQMNMVSLRVNNPKNDDEDLIKEFRPII